MRGKVSLETVAWDKPGAGTPMLATMTPQEAIAQGLPKPSECNIVIVTFWSRMGTPLPSDWKKPDGSPYLSGTEWEYCDALRAATQRGTPEILVYRRKQKLNLDPGDPDFEERVEQWKRVQAFFESFHNANGSIRGGYNVYETPAAFAEELENHLKSVIKKIIESPSSTAKPLTGAFQHSPSVWPGSPFPGLRPFTDKDAPIFFGRGRETDGLIRKLADPSNRLIAVVGASGSGKSSLVWSGLIPRLLDGAVEGSQDWEWIRFTPGEIGDNPFMALAFGFKATIERYGGRPRDVAEELQVTPEKVAEVVGKALSAKPDWAELLLFIDQFEELFTRVGADYRKPFIELLTDVVQTARVRVVVTLRADFYHRCLAWPELTELLETGQFPLAPPKLSALYEMITKPAERSGVTFEEGLTDRILEETGTEPGALPLMAFALAELWKAKTEDGCLTPEAYEGFGGVAGAIGKRAEDTFKGLQGDKATLETALARVFRELIEVDESGVATRRRAPLNRVADEEVAERLVSSLTEARLLVKDHGEGHEPMVEVAHEALFTSWPRLKAWKEATGDDLRMRRQVSQASVQWDAGGRAQKYLWSDDRVVDVVGMLDRLGLGLSDLSDTERRFLGPIDRESMLAELNDPGTPHERRATIGVRLSLLGDPRPGVGLRADGLPDIVWCQVPGGTITLAEEAGTFRVDSFYIAKYPVTYKKYLAFLEAEDGFKDDAWWQGLPYQIKEPARQFNQRDNHPAENVCWVDAVAFCHWLTAKLGYDIRLPTEGQWQLAATGGNPANEYPWGAEWDSGRTNTYESGLNRSTAVGMYPHGRMVPRPWGPPK
ncbi:MAG: SUMF1/EgtB/PvdO family nonheme iron enzyme [Desulfobacterales bacterium]|nr:MAG: SUMF1/EgtB/PvdO family nonheme iron enzyme [Desulfobacterales bacterium]